MTGRLSMRFFCVIISISICMLSALVHLPATTFAATTDDQFTQSMLAEVVPLFEKKDFKAAYKKLWEIVQEHPDNAELNFQLGMAALEIGRYEAAAAAFERVLIANPESHRARLELGRSFFQLKSYALAREQFEAVLATNPPKNVAAAIQSYIDAIDKQMVTHRFSGRIALGWQYDSNVGTAPGSDQISTISVPLTLGADSLPKVDNAVITQFFLSHFYDPGQGGGLVWQDSLSYYASRYKHLTKYNLDVITLNSGPGYANNGYRAHVPVTFDLVQLDNAPYARNWGIAPTVGYSGIKNLDLSLTGTVQRREYMTDKERDCDYYAAEFTPRFFLLNGKMMLQGSVKYADEEARRKYWSNEAIEGALGLMVQLPFDSVFFVQYGAKSVDYRGTQALYANSRKDREYRTLVNINKRLLKNVSITISYSYTRNHSNLDLYDYDRKQLTTMLAWEF